METIRRRWRIGLAVIVLTGAAWVTARAQAPMPASTGQMAELISEVKLMRAALQEMASGQSQMQALGIQISAQQSRVTQASASLDAATTQLMASTSRGKDVARELAATQAQLTRTTDITQRAPLEQRVAGLKQLLADLAAEESQIQTRVYRLQSTLNQEESRWQQLSGRLDAMVRTR